MHTPCNTCPAVVVVSPSYKYQGQRTRKSQLCIQPLSEPDSIILISVVTCALNDGYLTTLIKNLCLGLQRIKSTTISAQQHTILMLLIKKYCCAGLALAPVVTHDFCKKFLSRSIQFRTMRNKCGEGELHTLSVQEIHGSQV